MVISRREMKAHNGGITVPKVLSRFSGKRAWWCDVVGIFPREHSVLPPIDRKSPQIANQSCRKRTVSVSSSLLWNNPGSQKTVIVEDDDL